jgi:solute:Na+ symporter, SSS family
MIHPLALTIIFLCLLIVPLVGYISARRSKAADYIHAGRRVSLPALVATLVCTWYGGILGVCEFTWTYGLVNWLALGVFYYVFAAIYAWLLAKKIRVSSSLSIPGQIEKVHGKAAGIFSACYTLLMVTPAPYILMTGLILSSVAGIPLLPALFIAVILTVAYVLRGGLGSVIATDIVQFVLMFVAFAAVLVWLVFNQGGLSWLSTNLPPTHLAIPGSLLWPTVFLWGFVALWTLVDPGFHQRVAVARDTKTARRGIYYSILFWFIFDGLTTFCGLYARALFPHLENPAMAFPSLATLLPPALAGLFLGGMLATVLSTLDSFCFLSGITISRDLLGSKGGPKVRLNAQLGIIVATMLSAVLAWLIPSVVKMWLTIASLGVPVLLPVLVHSYLTTAKTSPSDNFWSIGLISMLAGASTSLGWFSYGFINARDGWPQYPFGLDPIYPALLASAGIIALSVLSNRLKLRH